METKCFKDQFWNRILLWKAYLDKGLGLTNYVKYVIAFFGIASSDVNKTMWIAFYYAIFCFFLGWAWYRFRIIDMENEIGNRFNPFCRDVREKL